MASDDMATDTYNGERVSVSSSTPTRPSEARFRGAGARRPARWSALGKSFWSEAFGMLVDRFGTPGWSTAHLRFRNERPGQEETVLTTLATIAAVLSVILVSAAMKPATSEVTRTRMIHAGPRKIVPLIEDSARGAPGAIREARSLDEEDLRGAPKERARLSMGGNGKVGGVVSTA